MKQSLFIILLFNLLLFKSMGQTRDFYGNAVPDDICNQFGFVDDESAKTSLNNICNAAGIPNNYVLVNCQNIDNCFAVYRNKTKYILYDLNFLRKIKKFGFTEKNLPLANTDWQSMTILAHELGHHHLKHLTGNTSNKTLVDLELEADRFAGGVLYKLKANLQQAQSVMHNDFVRVTGSLSHPSRQARLEAIEKGFNEAKVGQPEASVEYTAEDVAKNITLHVRLDNTDRKRFTNGTQVAYHYYLAGPQDILDAVQEVRYVRNHDSFYEYIEDTYQSSMDRKSNFDYKGYQWGYISDTYVTVVLKDGTISEKRLYKINYD